MKLLFCTEFSRVCETLFLQQQAISRSSWQYVRDNDRSLSRLFIQIVFSARDCNPKPHFRILNTETQWFRFIDEWAAGFGMRTWNIFRISRTVRGSNLLSCHQEVVSSKPDDTVAMALRVRKGFALGVFSSTRTHHISCSHPSVRTLILNKGVARPQLRRC